MDETDKTLLIDSETDRLGALIRKHEGTEITVEIVAAAQPYAQSLGDILANRHNATGVTVEGTRITLCWLYF